MARVLAVTTGWNLNVKGLLKTGERIYNLERLLAVRDDISRKDDTLPHRLLSETLPSGPAKGIKLGKKEFNRMLDEYYGIRGWDTEGRPKREKLEEFGLPKLLEE